jgi:hypothetical protein
MTNLNLECQDSILSDTISQAFQNLLTDNTYNEELIRAVKFTNDMTEVLTETGMEITVQDLTLTWRGIITFNL